MNEYDATMDVLDLGVVAVEASSASLARIATSLGGSLPEGARSVGIEQGVLHRSGPESLLVLCDAKSASELATRIHDELDEPSAIAADLSDGHAWIGLAGPGALSVLAQGVAIDLRESALEPGQATRTLAFGVEVILHRIRPDAFRVGCRASHGEFLLARLHLARDPLKAAC